MSIEHFRTERLEVRHWRTSIRNGSPRDDLMSRLPAILTDRVLEQLPPPLQLPTGQSNDPAATLSSWIDARAAESDVFLVTRVNRKELVGLMILACDTEAVTCPTCHIGYLLAEIVWGRGIASELVAGLVSAMADQGPVKLVGGVARNNAASARVLEKNGFVRDPELSGPGTDMYVLAPGCALQS